MNPLRGSPIEIGALSEADVPACVELATTVDWNTDPVKWSWMFSLGEAFGAMSPDGALAGTIVVMPFATELAMIAMMIVRRSQQRRGIGRRLLERALAASPCSVNALYATDAGQLLYRPLGFADAGSSRRFDGDVVSLPARSHETRALDASDLEAVIALDAQAQGAERRALLRSLFDARETTCAIDRRGQLAAFGMAFDEPDARRIGPIVAATDSDAELVANALCAGAPRARIDLEPGESVLASWASAVGLEERDASLRMTRERGMPGARNMSRAMVGRPFG